MNENLAIQTAVGQIAPAEIFEPNAYWDVNGWAIGYGFHYYSDGTAVKQGDTMTQEQADAYVVRVAAEKWNAIKPCIQVDLNENQAAALIDLAYNCGEGTVCHSHLLELINAGAPADQISGQWDQTCVTAGGQYMSGLYNRRVDETKLFFANAKDFVMANPATVMVGAALVLSLMGLWIYRAVYKK